MLASSAVQVTCDVRTSAALLARTEPVTAQGPILTPHPSHDASASGTVAVTVAFACAISISESSESPCTWTLPVAIS
jgi:hypothetical protein